MTREEAKEMLPIMQAFAKGKTIQDWTNDTWKDKEYMSFGELSQSPIKPAPKYRPFKNQEECWNEMLKHQPFGWVKEISSGILYLINSILDSGIAIMEDVDIFEEAINFYEFKDGTPFGIKEE